VSGRGLAVVVPAAALALALAGFLLRTWQVAGRVGLDAFPLDDAWIHLHFARNLAEGHGFSFNPGIPVSGSTAPLWTLCLGATFALLGSHPVLAKAAGIAATLGAAVLAGRLAWLWTGGPGLGLLAAGLVALAGPMVWGALSGMEVALAALLVTGALVQHARGRVWGGGMLLALAALSRPEAIVLAPLFWLAGPLTVGRLAAWAVPATVALAPWAAFSLATTGTPWPATAAAKIEGGLVGLLAGAREPLWRMLVERPWQFEVEWARWLWRVDVLLPCLLLPGLWWLGRRVGRAALVPASVLLLHPLAMAVLAPYRGPSFQEGRYSIHLLPLACVVAVAALAPLLAAGARAADHRATRTVGRLLAVALLAAAVAALPSAATRYGWGVQNIEAMQVHLGHWVARHTEPDARIATNDVGAIAYVSRRPLIDVMGLITPAIIPFRRDGEAGVLRFLEHACPDYLIVFPAWFPVLTDMADRFHPVYRVRLERNEVAGADELVVYEAAWSRWRRDRQPCPGALAGADRPSRKARSKKPPIV
jgi:arabinofuranosyltransferase